MSVYLFLIFKYKFKNLCFPGIDCWTLYYTECSWKGHDCVLNIHWEDGFTLFDAKHSRQSSRGLLRLWYFPFERLKGSGDDSKHSLWIDFGGDEGRQVRAVEYSRIRFLDFCFMVCLQDFHIAESPKYIVFVLHTFLSAKTARLGLFA